MEEAVDRYIGFWIIDLPYVFDTDLDNVFGGESLTSRRYLLHENAIVYDEDGKKDKLYRLIHQAPLYLFDPRKMTGCLRFFMVMNPYIMNEKDSVHINGSKLSLPNDNPIYLRLPRILSMIDYPPYLMIAEKKMRWKGFVPDRSHNHRYNIKPALINKVRGYNGLLNRVEAENYRYRNPDREYPNPIRSLPDDFPQASWSSRIKTRNLHWGQLKLLMGEIDFLNWADTDDNIHIVVYAGAAPGNHIPFLSLLFPKLFFILYDPADFDIEPSSTIVIRQEFFTDEVAHLYKGMGVIFISDIRLGSDNEKEHEHLVHKDNCSMERWVEIMEPMRASLKFRFPFDWKDPSYRYLNGTIHVQQFAPPTSAETRLWIGSDRDKRLYDVKSYEEKLFYYNTEYRNRSFLDLEPIFGINFDTWATFQILLEYLQKNDLIANKEPPFLKIAAMILDIQEALGKDTISRAYFPWLR